VSLQEPPDRREDYGGLSLEQASATASGGRLWERFYSLVERPPEEERPALWTTAWVILPLVAGVASLWVSALLARAFAGPQYSWPGFAIALALALVAVLALARPYVRRLGRAQELRAPAVETVAGWSALVCIAGAAAGAAAGQALDNNFLLTLALVATAAALLVLTGLATGTNEVYVVGMVLAWGVLIFGAFIAVLALIRTGACAAAPQCVP
jgi:hypothetical protein